MTTKRARTPGQPNGRVRFLTREQARQLFDEAARRYLNMSGNEFQQAWHRGEFDDDPDRPEVMNVATLLPLVE